MELEMAEPSFAAMKELRMNKRRSRLLPGDDGTAILIERYEGAYGDTIRIDIQSMKSLKAYENFLLDLCASIEDKRSLRTLENSIFIPPLKDIILIKSESSNIRTIHSAEETGIVTWSQPLPHWEDTIALVRGLNQSNHDPLGGHQYLTGSGQGLLVELAFKE